MAAITGLIPLKRRVIIMVDGRRFACIPLSWAKELELKEYEEIDIDELSGTIASRQFENAYNYALDLLAASMRTKKQLLEKLAARGCCKLTLEMVSQRLEESGLLNDAAFARRRVELNNARGKGKRAAVTDLVHKGVDFETARQAVGDWDSDAEQRAADDVAYKFLRKRWFDGDERKARMQTMQALGRRGYAMDIARSAVESAAQRLREENEDDE